MAVKKKDGATREAIMERIKKHDDYLSALVAVVPPKFYLEESDVFVNNSWKKFEKNKQQKNPKLAVKENTKKAKRQKLDPNTPRATVIDIQRKKGAAGEGEETAIKGDGAIAVRFPQKGTAGPAASIGELRQRMDKRLALFKKQRKTFDRPAKDPANRKDPRKDKQRKPISRPAPSHPQPANHAKPVPSDGPSLVFSKLEVGGKDAKKKKQGSGQLKQLLAKGEAKRAKLETLRKTDPQKARAMEEKEAQQRAVALSRGTKIKDDVKLLKKTVKRKSKAKEKSASAWKEREKAVAQSQARHTAKRNENIAKRKEAKINSRRGIKKDKSKAGKKGKGKPSRAKK